MTKQNKNILSTLFLAISAIAFWQAWQSFSGISAVQAQIDDYTEKNIKAEESLTRIRDFSKFIKGSGEKIEKLNLILPESDSVPNLISMLDNLLYGQGLSLKSIKFSSSKREQSVQPQGIDSANAVKKDYEVQEIDLAFSGSYASLKKSLDAIENNLKIMDISSLEVNLVSSNPLEEKKVTAYEIRVKAKTYWQPEEKSEEVPDSLGYGLSRNLKLVEGKQFNSLVFPDKFKVDSSMDEKNSNIF